MRYFAAFGLLAIMAVPVLAGTTQEVVGDPTTYGPQTPVPLWERPAVVLFDQSDLVTIPGGGFGGADVSELQTALGLGIYGFGHQWALGNGVADDFTIPAGETWTINEITTFAYQTGSPTTSTITGVYWEWFDGIPGAGGNPILGDNFTTNFLGSSDFSNIYRALDTSPQDNGRPIMANVSGPLGVVLTEGTYWLAWSTDGTLGSGPWVPPVTLVGQTTTGDAYQSTDGGYLIWDPLVDVGGQGMPFIVDGDMGGATPTEDVNWSNLKATFGE